MDFPKNLAQNFCPRSSFFFWDPPTPSFNPKSGCRKEAAFRFAYVWELSEKKLKIDATGASFQKLPLNISKSDSMSYFRKIKGNFSEVHNYLNMSKESV
jgi:hypothetical protein